MDKEKFLRPQLLCSPSSLKITWCQDPRHDRKIQPAILLLYSKNSQLPNPPPNFPSAKFMFYSLSLQDTTMVSIFISVKINCNKNQYYILQANSNKEIGNIRNQPLFSPKVWGISLKPMDKGNFECQLSRIQLHFHHGNTGVSKCPSFSIFQVTVQDSISRKKCFICLVWAM